MPLLVDTRKVIGITLSILLALAFAVVLDKSTAFAGPSDYLEDYTGADADKVGSATCLLCHADSAGEENHAAIIDGDEDDDNYGFSCEGCHGPGANHNGLINGILNPAKMDFEGVTETCTSCHEEKGGFALDSWEGSTHAESEISCLNCHGGHTENGSFLVEEDSLDVCGTCHSDKVEALGDGHGVEGMDSCTVCHNPHAV